MKKYFLHDGAYNWIHILSLGAEIKGKTKSKKIVKAGANIGFLYSYYTMIDSDDYDRSIYGNNGNCNNASENTPFYYVDTDEYPLQFGLVLGASLKILF